MTIAYKSRPVLNCLVDQLAIDTLKAMELWADKTPKRTPIVFVGYDELMAIRYINNQAIYSRQSEHEEHFMGCLLIGVRLPSYFNVCVGIENGK